MNQVFGTMTLSVSVDVEAKSEQMGLLEANYKYNPDMVIGYELYAVKCNGEKIAVNVHSCDEVDLTEFVDCL